MPLQALVAKGRRGAARGATENVKRLSKADLERGRAQYPDVGQHAARPRTRGECPPIGPCPWVSCQHHLYLDVNERTGSIKINFPRLESWQLREPCALRIAERGDGATLEEIADAMNLTRERARQLETRALASLALSTELRSHAGQLDLGAYQPAVRAEHDQDQEPSWDTLRHVLYLAGWHEGRDGVWRSGLGRRLCAADAKAAALRLWRAA